MATWIPRSAGIDVPSIKLIHSLGLDLVKRLSINIYFDAPNSINAEPMMHEEPSDSVTKTNDGAEASEPFQPHFGVQPVLARLERASSCKKLRFCLRNDHFCEVYALPRFPS